MIPVLNRTILWDAIDAFLKESKEKKENERLLESMQSVLNLLFSPTEWNHDYGDKTAIENKAELMTNSRNNLIGYTFYLTSSPQFNYNWSYLLNKIKAFTKMLVAFEEFVDEFIKDVNALFSSIKCRQDDLTFDFNGFLKISHNGSSFAVAMNLMDFHKALSKCRKDNVTITVYLGKTILGTYHCKESSDVVVAASKIEKSIVKGRPA